MARLGTHRDKLHNCQTGCVAPAPPPCPHCLCCAPTATKKALYSVLGEAIASKFFTGLTRALASGPPPAGVKEIIVHTAPGLPAPLLLAGVAARLPMQSTVAVLCPDAEDVLWPLLATLGNSVVRVRGGPRGLEGGFQGHTVVSAPPP